MKYVLMILLAVVALASPLFNSVEPRLFGFPFFYWVQMVLIPACSLVIFIVYRLEDRAH